MSKAWKTKLETKLHELYKQKETMGNKKDPNFSESYIDLYSLDQALSDLDFIAQLSDDQPLTLHLYQATEKDKSYLHLRLFQLHEALSLSDILPILENFDLRITRENIHKILLAEQQCVWVSDFCLIYEKEFSEFEAVTDLFQNALYQVYQGTAENDGFNKLVLGASLTWREVSILRAYAKYLVQIGFRFSQIYMEKTLSKNTEITRDLVNLFLCRFSPDTTKEREKKAAALEQEIQLKLGNVPSLDEDYIIRRFLALIKATVRTNYFQQQSKSLAFKLDSTSIPDLPLPAPLCEIFVYSPDFEGIHLRKERIARGGIRWSERPEDFRTEVLGLMKAQVVKNTVIVPSGAKGGFVLKKIPEGASREVVQELVVTCYKLFISALLSLTDNIKKAKPVPPKEVVCYDEVDPYLVVAADKGTATFSDIANSLSEQHHFWLGDAFASGGSAGYDHKKMGITARGSWESVKRHFRELDCDVQNTDITVVGIGDMSGDVFGNGLLYSRHIKLLGAFDHRHVFIDPQPNPELSYIERERMFKLPSSSWADYKPELISAGGGIFSRSLKSIKITPEMKQAFAIEDDVLTPNELIVALLKAPVDLLYNGGIGTYVKSSLESNMDVGDRNNDYCRVNGNELRCKIVGEGGNMGLTQRGRVEYAENGGLIYTDFIDNSAGVDCSDHEVNLKILLSHAIEKGELLADKRNQLLASLTDEVATLVLNDNKAQALVMSETSFSAKENISLHADYIRELETQGLLNRKVEFLPNDKALAERKAAGLGLTRPELAVVLAYTKIYIKKEILKSNLPEDAYIKKIVETAFPPSVRTSYAKTMSEHRLKRDIIATQLSNKLVNQMGFTFIYRMQSETGGSIEEIIRAFIIASESFEAEQLQQIVESLDFKIPMKQQFEILGNIRKLIHLSTRWFFHGEYHKHDLQKVITHFSSNIKKIEYLIPQLMTGMTKNYLSGLVDEFTKANISKEVAERFARNRAIYTTLNIIEVATTHKLDLEKTAKIYFTGGERMNLVWFRDKLTGETQEDFWHTLTRLTLRDELDLLQRKLTVAIIQVDKNEQNVDVLIDKWVKNNQSLIERWDKFLVRLHESTSIDYSMFFIAIRELTNLIHKSNK